MIQKNKLSNHLGLTTALTGILFVGYGGRNTYAGTCTEAAAGTYTCSNPADATNDITQILSSTGFLTITTTAGFGIDTSSSGSHALNLYTAAAGSDLSFVDNYSSSITGASSGIVARNHGSGTTSITTTGAVTGTSLDGIVAYNINGSSLSLTVNYGSVVTASDNGINADNNGTGASTIIINGTVNADYSEGLDFDDTVGSGAVTITVGETGIVASSKNDGLEADAHGVGDLTVTVNGRVTGDGDRGVGLSVDKDSTGNIIVTTGASSSVTGGTGIRAMHDGNGALTITTTGVVTGTKYFGIRTYNGPSSTDLTLNVLSDVSGAKDGIFIEHSGTGATTVTTTGRVTGTAYFGIWANNNSSSGDLTLNTQGDVSGAIIGISAYNKGTGAISITTTGVVTGTTYYGIYALNSDSSGDLTVNTQDDVSGGEYGIYARNPGTGATTINISAAVTGGFAGIRAWTTNSTQPLSITTSGAVSGGSDYAIYTHTDAGVLTKITINSPTVVSSTYSWGIFNNEGDSSISVNTGASVLGDISLFNGSDDLTFSGGDFSGVTLFDGGDDITVTDTFIDTLTFAGSSGLLVAADVINWENIVIEAGSTISFDGIANLRTPSLSNAGSVSLQDGAIGDALILLGDFTGGGSVNLDTVVEDGTGGTDLFTINGDVSGTTILDIANVGGAGALTTGDGIMVVKVNGVSPATGFSMSPFVVGDFQYQLVQVGSNWYLQSSTQVNIFSNGFE